MLTQAPLPTWFNLGRFLLRRSPSDFDLAAPWRREADVAGWLSRSAWALALIALWRRNRTPDVPITIWIPDFFCNASLGPLRQTGVRLVFYPVTDKMVPDMAACRLMADAGAPDLFVLVHYFGRPTPSAAARDFCMHHGAWLIEDAAHVLRPVEGVGTYGDFVFYSPHKHLPIPDGAVLVARPNGPSRLGPDVVASLGSPEDWSDQLREVGNNLGGASNGQAYAIRWLIKRMLQKLGVRSWRCARTPFFEAESPVAAAPAWFAMPSMSGIARRLLAGMLSDFGAETRRRQRHQMLWDALLPHLRVSDADMVVATERPAIREWTPYLSAYGVDPALAEGIYKNWQCQGLPVTTWPDLPPEVVMHRDRYANAWRLRHSCLYLPVHQSLNARDMLALCRLTESIHEPELYLRMEWNDVNHAQWQQMLRQAGRSSLLQSWTYGEAKLDHSGWQANRGVFYLGSEPIAMVQVLQKRVAGLISVSRINRGPLCFRALTAQEQRALWKGVSTLGGLWRGKLLSVAPDIRLSGASLAMLADMGFRQFSPQAWESVWIDLDLDLESLRKRLDGKWRNMLAFAERSLLQLEVGSDDELFDWMIGQYQELMQDKEFSGTPVGFLGALRKRLGDQEPLLILRAIHEGKPVAGICLARHGAAATYLLGWNGNEGRNLKANQYLLWKAITQLKQLGLRWFDLGGISEEMTPGITAFKMGLNGERYELVGEYWKW